MNGTQRRIDAGRVLLAGVLATVIVTIVMILMRSRGSAAPANLSSSSATAPIPLPSAFIRTEASPKTILHRTAGECVILHYQPMDVSMDVADVLRGDPLDPQDDGSLYDDPDDPWCQSEEISCFNCNTFAVGPFVGLTTRDWIWGDASELTNHVSPLQVLIDSHYRYVKTINPYDAGAAESFTLDPELQADDLVCFVGVDPSGKIRDHAHAARIWKKGTQNWLIGKLGAGPIVITPLTSQARNYAGFYNQVQIYRFDD